MLQQMNDPKYVNHLMNISQILVSKQAKMSRHPTNISPTICPINLKNSMYLEPIESQVVLEATIKLKTKLSSGHDNISTKLIKETINQTLQPITHIINKSFETGVVPHDMKIAKAIPIFKAGDNTLMKNYRPV